jgi:hypothetical protein
VTGEDAVAFFGVPDDYPGFADLGEDATEAMIASVEALVAQACAEDPFLEALVSGKVSYWLHVEADPSVLPTGTRVPGYGVDATLVSVNEWWVTVTVGRPPTVRSVHRTACLTVRAVVPCPLDGSSFRAGTSRDKVTS